MSQIRMIAIRKFLCIFSVLYLTACGGEGSKSNNPLQAPSTLGNQQNSDNHSGDEPSPVGKFTTSNENRNIEVDITQVSDSTLSFKAIFSCLGSKKDSVTILLKYSKANRTAHYSSKGCESLYFNFNHLDMGRFTLMQVDCDNLSHSCSLEGEYLKQKK
jgi:hypothetical protein